MKRKALLTASLLSLWVIYGSAQTVFTVANQADATISVYAIQDSSMADLVVFKAQSLADVGTNNGVWFFTSSAADASKKIFFTDNINDAQVWIYYTPILSNAGWQNKAKAMWFN